MHCSRDTIADISDYVHSIVAAHLPAYYEKIKVFVDVLPLNYYPTSYPFESFVINIQVATDGHLDPKDDTLCFILPFGNWTGGGLVLHELGIVVELTEGTGVLFPSSDIGGRPLHTHSCKIF
jgi:hypothetical protein